jgi:peptidoglycan hydrolase-like protein with peptidoglycan-binding domain
MLFGLSFVATPNASAASAATKKSFITSLITAAQTAQRQYGVPTSVSIAQAAINTNYGTTKLATSAKNLFSTRCTAKLSAAQFAKLAEAQIGKAYVLGAEASIDNNNPKAFDCSELVQWLYGRSGNPITDLAASQYNVTSKVSGTPKPGDLVFLRNNPARANGIGHVAVVTKKLSSGDWEIIEARGRKYGVVKTTLSYWKARSYYAGLRRYAKLNFVGDSGVTSASAANAYQAGCLSITTSGKTLKYSKFSSLGDSVLGHAAIVADGSEYASSRKAMSNVSAFVDAIAKTEHSSDASAYAKSVRAVISEYDLTQYDVAPLSIVLLSGNKGNKVTALQYLLSGAGKKVSPTGKFDSATVAAVKAVQSSKKLGVDGQAGPNTITALMATVKPGDSSDRVKAVKVLLGLAGFPAEGGAAFGPTMASSLKSFQAGAGLTASGTADAKTWSRLFMLLETAPTPTVTGKTVVGQTLAASPGTWGPGKVDLSYQWYRGSTAIAGATGATYALQPADAGQTIKVTTTGTKATYTTITRWSASTAAVTPARLTATPTPKVSGSAETGKVLTATAGSWTPAPVALSYQWYRNSAAIAGATSASYRLQAADYKTKVHVVVTGAKSGFYSAAKASASTAVIKQGKIASAATPTISGKLAVGQTLTAKPGVWSPAPAGFAYQWFRDKTAIKGATAATYKLQLADAGHTLLVKVTNAGGAFATVTRTSAATAKVAKLNWTAAPNPAIAGTAKVGKTLTVKAGAWAPEPKLSYQWYRGSTAIKGATKTTYKLTKADKGKTITVKVTAKRTGYATVTRQASVKAS